MTPSRSTIVGVLSRARSSDVARSLGLLLVYTLLAWWWLSPTVSGWSNHVPYHEAGHLSAMQRADLFLIAWTLSWVSHALVSAPAALFDGNTFFPAPLSVAYSEHLLGYVPLFAPVYLTTGNSILALNVMGAVTYPLSAFFTDLYARRYMGHGAAALSGFFYAFTLGRYLAPPHFQMLGIQYFPLVLLATEDWLASARARDAVLLAIALVLQCLSSVYLLYAVFLMYGPFALLCLWRWREGLDKRRILGLIGVALVVAAALGATMWPYVILRAQGLVDSYDESRSALGLVPWAATARLRGYLADRGIGPVGYLLVLAALWSSRSERIRWPRRVAILLVAIGCLAALGPRIAVGGWNVWSPYALLRDLIPGFATVRSPVRFTVIAHLGFALLAGLGAHRLLRRARPLLAGCAVLATAVAALVAMSPDP